MHGCGILIIFMIIVPAGALAAVLSPGENDCSPCFCYPDLEAARIMWCQGRDIFNYPTLSESVTRGLREIFIESTLIVCLPPLHSASSYDSLALFRESDNPLWDCECMQSWMRELKDTHFATNCSRASPTPAASSSVETATTALNRPSTAVIEPSPETGPVGSGPTPEAAETGPAETGPAGTGPVGTRPGGSGAPEAETTPPGSSESSSSSSSTPQDASPSSSSSSSSGSPGRDEPALPGWLSAMMGIILTTAISALVGLLLIKQRLRKYCPCWRWCTKLRRARTTPLNALEMHDYAYINHEYSVSSV